MTISGYFDVWWIDPSLRWNASHYGNITKTFIPAKWVWKPELYLYHRYCVLKELIDNMRTSPKKSLQDFDHLTFWSSTVHLTSSISCPVMQKKKNTWANKGKNLSKVSLQKRHHKRYVQIIEKRLMSFAVCVVESKRHSLFSSRDNHMFQLQPSCVVELCHLRRIRQATGSPWWGIFYHCWILFFKIRFGAVFQKFEDLHGSQ